MDSDQSTFHKNCHGGPAGLRTTAAAHALSNDVTPPTPSSYPTTPQPRPTTITPTSMMDLIPPLASFHPPQSPRCPVSCQGSVSGPHHFTGRRGPFSTEVGHTFGDSLENSDTSAFSITPQPFDHHRFAVLHELSPPTRVVAADLHHGSVPASSLSSPLVAAVYRRNGQPHTNESCSTSPPCSPCGSIPRRHSSGLQTHFSLSATDVPHRNGFVEAAADDDNNPTTANSTAKPPHTVNDRLHRNGHNPAVRGGVTPPQSVVHIAVPQSNILSSSPSTFALASVSDLPVPLLMADSRKSKMLHFGGILDEQEGHVTMNGCYAAGSSSSPFSRSASVVTDYRHSFAGHMGVVQCCLEAPPQCATPCQRSRLSDLVVEVEECGILASKNNPCTHSSQRHAPKKKRKDRSSVFSYMKEQ